MSMLGLWQKGSEKRRNRSTWIKSTKKVLNELREKWKVSS